MTRDQYLNEHLPHRVNLLTTFRNRYDERRREHVAAGNQPILAWGEPRDFFRCSKDISFMMVRFFWDELGIALEKGKEAPRARLPRMPKDIVMFSTEEEAAELLELVKNLAGGQYAALVSVLKAANRAVAHIGGIDVDHPFINRVDHLPLFDVINLTEETIDREIYRRNGRSLQKAMDLEYNRM